MENSKDWQKNYDTSSERNKYLLDNQKWTDCTFIFNNECGKTSISGHKLILAAASPVFEAMFYGSMSNENQISITDIQPEIFKILLT